MKEAKPPLASHLQLDIANQVVKLIRAGQIQPGQHLTEQGLARQFDVSRSPVRAAFKLLEERGYLASRANAGVTVLDPPSQAGRREEFASEDKTADDLYRDMISDRAQGRLADILSEAELLSRYEVPKSVLMRTLLRMNREGLVLRRKGKGWGFLPALDSDEAKYESYRFRMMVECGGLREETFRVDAAALAQAREAHERFMRLAPGAQTSTAFYDMNARFHEMLAEFSGNRFVLQSVRDHNRLRRLEEYRRHVNNPINLSRPCNEHLEIMRALEVADLEWAAALLHRHLVVASKF